jgi:spermidine/putrescine transport system substrate-binding protein
MKKLALALALFAGCGKPAVELHVLQWADYFAPDTLANFEKEFGCKVKVDYIESSETLRAKLARTPSGYDVVFPSDEVLASFIAAGVIEKLDLSRLPNFKHIAARFRGPGYDPKNDYSVPYMWGTTGIAYSKKEVNPAPDSWAVLWDPKVAGKVALLDDAREVFAAAMWLDGTSPLTPTAETIEKAKKRLLGVKPLAYDSSPKVRLIKGEAWVAQCFNGDALQAGASDERKADIGFVIPKEGGTLWIDNIAIAKGAPNLELAYKFIDYLLRPEVSAAISNEVQYANPNEAAMKLIKPEVAATFPTEAELGRCLLLLDLPPDPKKKLEDAWAELKAR